MGKKNHPIDAHGTSPVENYLAGDPFLFEKANWAQRLVSRNTPVGKKEEFLLNMLGRWSFTWVGGSENRRFKVWDRPTYRLFWHKDAGWSLEIPEEGANQDKALDAIYEFLRELRLVDEDLPGSECAKIEKDTIAALGSAKLAVDSMPVEALRKFVVDYCNGVLITDKDIRDPSMIGMVFLPLAFATPSEEVVAAVDKVIPPTGPAPQIPQPPQPPSPIKRLKKPDPLPRPPRPEPLLPDPEVEAKIRRDASWGLTPDKTEAEALEEYRQHIAIRNLAQEAKFLEAVQEMSAKDAMAIQGWEADCEAKQNQDDAARAALRKAMKRYERAKAKADKQIQAWIHSEMRRKVALRAANAHYMRDLGCIWGSLSDSLSRTINGLPCLQKCSMMSVSDWDRASAAIRRELDRRTKIKI